MESIETMREAAEAGPAESAGPLYSPELSQADLDERELLIFRLLLLNKYFLIPSSLAYIWYLSNSYLREHVHDLVSPTIVYTAVSMVSIILLWLCHHRVAEGSSDPAYARAALAITLISFGLDALFVFLLVFLPEAGNVLWTAFLFPMTLPLLIPRWPRFSLWPVDGVFAAAMLIALVGTLAAYDRAEPARHFMEGDFVICLSSLLFMWAALRPVRNWTEGINRRIRDDLAVIALWTEVLRRFPSDYFVVNDHGELLTASNSARNLLKLPGVNERQWPEASESVRNALLLRFHADRPIDEPVTILDGDTASPLKIYPTFFGFQKRRYCIALIQEERHDIGPRVDVVRSDRLAIAGRIASGLAHELGNPLGVIQSCAAYLRQKAKPDDPNFEEYELIETESKRCQNLIDRMLSLASPKRDTPGLFDLREILDHAVSMVRYQAGEREIEASFPHHKVMLYANEGQISAVFVNLLLNALQSMAGSPPNAMLRVHLKVRGAEAIVDVTDEGCGISSEDLEKIFDPFFTKKADGTGLGLSIVHQIVTSLGGRIDVASRVGSGTTFTVRLPLRDIEAD